MRFTQRSSVRVPKRLSLVCIALQICSILLISFTSGHSSAASEAPAVESTNFDGGDQSDAEEDGLSYDVELKIPDDELELQERLESASLLFQQQDALPEDSSALIRRAQNDQKRLVAVLYQEGFYGGLVDITIANWSLDGLELGRQNFGNGDAPVEVVIDIAPGEVFIFRDVAINDLGENGVRLAPEDFGLIQGESAEASKILAAETQIVVTLNNRGFPFASISDRSVRADHANNAVDTVLSVDSGDEASFGDVSIAGNERMESEFILRVANIPVNEPYSASILRGAEKRLRSLDVFNRARIHLADAVGPDGRIPLTINVSEKKSRYVGANFSISSVEGLTVSVSNGYRNLLGEAERLQLILTGSGVDQGEIEELDYSYEARFVNPAFIDENTDHTLNVGRFVNEIGAFVADTYSVKTGVVHRFSDVLTGSSNLVYEYTVDKDEIDTTDYGLVGLHTDLSWDSRNDRLNPTSGFNRRMSFEPVYEGLESHYFVIFQASGTNYWSIGSERITLASRQKVGSIYGTAPWNIPTNRRFLLGGGDSVRGFEHRSIGYKSNGEIDAGTSMLELSNEIRFQVIEPLGFSSFIDMGSVFDSVLPDFSEEIYVGAGFGLRYFTGIGPLRIDLAFPVTQSEQASNFAAYLGFGQVF